MATGLTDIAQKIKHMIQRNKFEEHRLAFVTLRMELAMCHKFQHY